jgi:NAD(P)-dependent dehydrogenase (short-subunit alcohol dehydrogenase family)
MTHGRDMQAGSVALVTGAGKGIGRAAAVALARKGVKVALLSRDEVSGQEAVAACQAVGGAALWLAADVASEEQVRAAFDELDAHWGRLDFLVNNAGIYAQGDVVSTTLDDWERLQRVNVTGSFLCAKYAVPLMRRSGGGSIINVASEAGLVGIPGQVAYNVSKAALIALTRSLAVDLAADHIRVNCVCPGTTLTPLVEASVASDANPEKRLAHLENSRPAGRLGTPEEIAGAIVYFAADHARYTTGAVLSVDGGYTAQ